MRRGQNKFNPKFPQATPHLEGALTERQYEILRFVGHCKYVTKHHVMPFFSHLVAAPVRGKKTNQAISNDLETLFHYGRYLDRPHHETQKAMDAEREDGGKLPLVYSLTQKGRDALISWQPDKEDEFRHYIRVASSKSKVYIPNLKHYLMVTQFYVLLTLALRQAGGHYLRRQFEGPRIGNTRGRHAVWRQPDFAARVRVCGDSGIVRTTNMLLEAERTSKRHKFGEKLRHYIQLYRSGALKQAIGTDPVMVLVVTSTKAKRNSWRKLAEKSELPQMFWFAHEADFDLKNPETFWHELWVRGESEEPVSIFPS